MRGTAVAIPQHLEVCWFCSAPFGLIRLVDRQGRAARRRRRDIGAAPPRGPARRGLVSQPDKPGCPNYVIIQIGSFYAGFNGISLFLEYFFTVGANRQPPGGKTHENQEKWRLQNTADAVLCVKNPVLNTTDTVLCIKKWPRKAKVRARCPVYRHRQAWAGFVFTPPAYTYMRDLGKSRNAGLRRSKHNHGAFCRGLMAALPPSAASPDHRPAIPGWASRQPNAKVPRGTAEKPGRAKSSGNGLDNWAAAV